MLHRPVPYLGKAYTKGTTRKRGMSSLQQMMRDKILRGDSPLDYEDVDCPCGANTNTNANANANANNIVLTAVERHGLDCRNVLCAACGLIRISPRWNQARYRRFYETQYRGLYNHVTTSKEEFVHFLAALPQSKQFGTWIETTISRHGNGSARPTVIEIGAGGGWNLAALPRNWRRIGYDVDQEYLAIAHKTFGLEMCFGFLENALDSICTADAVILSHVVEHFPNPEEALASLAVRMKPSALLLIEVPGLFRIHRSALDPMIFMQNAHTYTFCAQTLSDACGSASLEVLEIDETCRAVCRSSIMKQNRNYHPSLSKKILHYLRLCEIGFSTFLALRKIPLAGRLLGAIWKKIYFPTLKFHVPRLGRNR